MCISIASKRQYKRIWHSLEKSNSLIWKQFYLAWPQKCWGSTVVLCVTTIHQVEIKYSVISTKQWILTVIWGLMEGKMLDGRFWEAGKQFKSPQWAGLREENASVSVRCLHFGKNVLVSSEGLTQRVWRRLWMSGYCDSVTIAVVILDNLRIKLWEVCERLLVPLEYKDIVI